KKVFLILNLILIIIIFNGAVRAEEGNYYLQTSLHTFHYSDKDYQNNNQGLLGLEYHYTNNNLFGISYFKNTYEQSTRYFYFGRYYELHDFKYFSLTAKLTFGIVDGYDNSSGNYNTWMHEMETFPGIVLSLGLEKKPFRLDIVPFADAGIIVLTGVEF
ncbi:MAG: hypothetical protein ACOC2I_02960, partial [Halanaerobium sp.]